MNMQSEEILASIMSKLKEYKGNPVLSPIEEKERQKNLMKMFCIYTSLKKREKARQKQEEHKATTIHEEQKVENPLNDLDNCDQISEIEPCKNDRISSSSLPEDSVNEIKSEGEMLVEYLSKPEELCSDFSPISQECIKTEKEFEETEESFDESVEEHENSLNQFLMQLSKRLKRLPYRQRSKLEIEFFRRLIEVEECLELYNK